MTRLLLLTLLGFALSCESKVQEENDTGQEQSTLTIIEEIWAKDKGLRNVESVIYDEEHGVFYVSCGQNYEPGYAGFISKISKSGELLQLSWVDSLSRPTGMAIEGQWLYVADVNTLIVIDTKTGQIVEKHTAPIRNAGLNDVAIDELGRVYISASFVNSIYWLNGDELELWVQDDERLKWANGLAVADNKLIVGGLDLYSIDLVSKEILAINMKPAAHDFDGLASDGKSGYWLTTVDNGALWHLDHHGNNVVMDSTADYFGDLTVVNNQLIVPRGSHTTKEYYLSVFSIESPKGSFP
ncbi:MAG: hypothetical protein RIF33_15595 [Cyclobacteriaceae bacterium]